MPSARRGSAAQHHAFLHSAAAAQRHHPINGTNSVAVLQAPEHIICQWGLVLVVQADRDVVCLKEKELATKLELLYNKSLYMLALNLAQAQQVISPLMLDAA